MAYQLRLNWKYICLLLSFAVGLSSCASSPPIYYLQLHPVASSIETTTSDSGSTLAETDAQYLGERYGAIEVNLRIHNRSKAELVVDPKLFQATLSWKDTLGKQFTAPVPVIDRLTHIQETYLSRAKIEHQRNPYQPSDDLIAVEIIAAVAASAIEASVSKNKDPQIAQKNEEEKDRQRNQIEMERIQNQANFEEQRVSTKIELGNEITYLQDKLWDRSTLKPEETRVRSILLNSRHEGDTLILNLPLGNEVHRYVFRQTKIILN